MKIALYLIITTIAICLIAFWFQVYILGNYYQNAGLFFTILLGLAPVFILLVAIKTIIHIYKFK